MNTKPNSNQTKLSALQSASEECHTCRRTRHSSTYETSHDKNTTHVQIPTRLESFYDVQFLQIGIKHFQLPEAHLTRIGRSAVLLIKMTSVVR